jgi:hypothetical protein
MKHVVYFLAGLTLLTAANHAESAAAALLLAFAGGAALGLNLYAAMEKR